MITVELLNAIVDFFAALVIFLIMVGCIVIYNRSNKNIRAMLELLSNVFVMVLFAALTFIYTPEKDTNLNYFFMTFFTFQIYGSMFHMTRYVLKVTRTYEKDDKPRNVYKILKNTSLIVSVIACVTSFVVTRFQAFVVEDAVGIEFNLMPYIVSVAFVWIISGINLALAIIGRKSLGKVNVAIFIFCIILPLLSDFIFPVYLMPSSRPLMICVSMIILYLVQYISRDIAYHRNEAEVSRMRTQMLISVVQPHFIYNVLNSIYYIAGRDPELTKKSISAFSDYLRGNMDYMNYDKAILFEDELSHLKSYFELMAVRYDDRVKLELELREIDFSIPPMTLQPLVENSIKYGVKHVKGDLIVKIKSYNDNGVITVVVEDNGPGYHPDVITDERSAHNGIENVRARVKSICGGSVTVTNIELTGTAVIIRLGK